MLIESLKDPSVIVRDTGAWTIGRVCEILPDAVINEQFLGRLLQALVEGLDTEPRVASNVCWVSWAFVYAYSGIPVLKIGTLSDTFRITVGTNG